MEIQYVTPLTVNGSDRVILLTNSTARPRAFRKKCRLMQSHVRLVFNGIRAHPRLKARVHICFDVFSHITIEHQGQTAAVSVCYSTSLCHILRPAMECTVRI